MPDPLASLRLAARRYSRVTDEADDLLQDALLEALRAGRGDLTRADNFRWVVGTLRNLALMSARGAVRRRLREERWSAERENEVTLPPLLSSSTSPAEWRDHPALADLPPSLRQLAMLALSGHDRREIAWLLDLSDTALRQRIHALRKRLSAFEATFPTSTAASGDSHDHNLPLGLIRRALLPVVRASGAPGTHDPDGHLVILNPGNAKPHRMVAHIPQVGGNITRFTSSSTQSTEHSR